MSDTYKEFEITADMISTNVSLDEFKYTEQLERNWIFYHADVLIHIHNDLIGGMFLLTTSLPAEYESINDLNFDISYESSDMTRNMEFSKNMEREVESEKYLTELKVFDKTEGYARAWFACPELAEQTLKDLSDQLNNRNGNDVVKGLRQAAYDQLDKVALAHKQKSAA